MNYILYNYNSEAFRAQPSEETKCEILRGCKRLILTMDNISQSYGCNPRNPKGCIDQSQSLLREVRVNCFEASSLQSYDSKSTGKEIVIQDIR